jgi:hypothetical protein
VAREPRGGSGAAPGDGGEVAADVERVGPGCGREEGGREEGADEDSEQQEWEGHVQSRHGESNRPCLFDLVLLAGDRAGCVRVRGMGRG